MLLLTAFLFSAGYATIGLTMILLTVAAEAVAVRRLPWHRSPEDWPVAAFLGTFLLAGWLSDYRPVALGSAGLGALTVYLAYGVPYRALLRDDGLSSKVLTAWVAGGAAAALWGTGLLATRDGSSFTGVVTPALGQNAVGTTSLVALVLALTGFVLATRLRRVSYGLAAAGAMLALVLSYTRGAWIGGLAGLALFFVLLPWRRTWRAAVLVLLIVSLGVIVTGPRRSVLLWRTSAAQLVEGNRVRWSLGRAALAIASDHPVVGTGLNTFSLVYPSYRRPEDPGTSPTQPFAHNIILNMAAEGGGLGAATFLALIGVTFVHGWAARRRAPGDAEAIRTTGILAAFAGMMTHQLFDGTVISVHLGAGMWFLMALLTAAHTQYDRALGRHPDL